MKLSELAMREPQHCMVFGASKSGKSTLVSKLAEKRKLLWFSLDNGHRVLYKLPPEWQENIEVIVCPDTRNFPIAMDIVRKLLRGDKLNLCHAHSLNDCPVCKKNAPEKFSKYCTKELEPGTVVVLDHLTQLTDSCMALICKNQAIDYKPKLDDWGSLRFFMSELMSEIQQARYDIVCIAQEMETEFDDGKKKIVPSVGSREFGKSVGSFFDHIIYCEVMNKSHKVGSGTTYATSVLTGSRSDLLIEGQKDGASLLPFISGEIAKPSAQGAAAAAKVLGKTFDGNDTVRITTDRSLSGDKPGSVEGKVVDNSSRAGNSARERALALLARSKK